MSYSYDGELILQDCIIKGKRFVIGDNKKSIDTDIREWISFEDNNIMRGILDGLNKNMGLPKTRNRGDFDKRAMIIWNYVIHKIKYVHDMKKYKKRDFWLFPPEISALGMGDCEDSSFFLASLLIASGISPFCVRVVFGNVTKSGSKKSGSHCWVAYKNEDGVWCLLESTIDSLPSKLPVASKYHDGRRSLCYTPKYCFNNYHLWGIYSLDGDGPDNAVLMDYLDRRSGKINIKDSQLSSGGWMSFETGHLDVTELVLKLSGFSTKSISIASDASQDPDFYEWDNPAAHAQTCEDSRCVRDNSYDAKGAFTSWVKNNIERIKISASGGAHAEAVYLLGYTLHGIQDLPSHRGITNSQHSYLSYELHESPDSDNEGIENAVKYSAQFLDLLKKELGADFNSLKNYDGKAVERKDKVAIHGKNWNELRFAKEIYKYMKLSGRYMKVMNEIGNDIAWWDHKEIFTDRIIPLFKK